MKKSIFILFICLIISYVCTAQDTLQVRKYIQELTSPQMHGRGYAYHGDSIAAEYLRQQFRLLHLASVDDNNYYQPYGFNTYAMEGKVMIKIGEQLLSPFDDYRIAPYSKSINQNVTITSVKPFTIMSKEKLQSFIGKNQKKLENGFVYIDISGIKYKDKEEKELFLKKLRALQYNNPFGSLGIFIGVDELPVWSPSSNHIERNYALIHIKAEKMGRTGTAEISFHNRYYYHHTQNVCGYIKGTVAADSFIVFSAHYDHLGAMGDEVYFPGAHDNASGTAMVLDFAHYYSQHLPYYSVAFFLFSGEETGLHGSSYAAQHPLIPLQSVKLLLNLDLLCGGDEGITIVNTKEGKGKEIYDTMTTLNEQYRLLNQIKSRDNAAISDHFPFTQKNVPALYIYTMGGRTGGYHHFSDTSENCSLSEYSDIFKLITMTLSKE